MMNTMPNTMMNTLTNTLTNTKMNTLTNMMMNTMTNTMTNMMTNTLTNTELHWLHCSQTPTSTLLLWAKNCMFTIAKTKACLHFCSNVELQNVIFPTFGYFNRVLSLLLQKNWMTIRQWLITRKVCQLTDNTRLLF